MLTWLGLEAAIAYGLVLVEACNDRHCREECRRLVEIRRENMAVTDEEQPCCMSGKDGHE